MGNQILIRNVPDHIKKRIDRERQSLLMSQQEYLLKLLEDSTESPQFPLFDDTKEFGRLELPNTPFTFVDLFAGIGGFRIGFERVGGRCIYSVEWDKYAQKTYKAWFGEVPHGDIRKIRPADIPDHDIMLAGFPCQPFSLAGVSKKKSLGREHGFKDKTQGTLFFHLATIAQIKRPPILVLENVRNLLSHDKGHTWEVIKSTLEELDYKVHHKVIDGADYVPQHRKRVFIVCFDVRIFGKRPPFSFPSPPTHKPPKFKKILERNPDRKYTLSDHLWQYLQDYARSHRERGNGFGFGIADPNGRSRTLSARYYKDGSEILIAQNGGRNPRRMTPREAARLMGFDDSLPIVVSDTQAYRQFGNAVIPIVTEAIAKQVVRVMAWQITRNGNGCLLKSGKTRTTRKAVLRTD